jgi:hypothetical protein
MHAVAQLMIAGPQYAAVGDIRLAARPGGFGGWNAAESNSLELPDEWIPSLGDRLRLHALQDPGGRRLIERGIAVKLRLAGRFVLI